MKNIYFDQKILENMESPFQKLMELNIRTIQGMSYTKPGEIFNIKRPEELFERNMDMFIQNSHMALNYMRNVFNIWGNHWLEASYHDENPIKQAVAVKKNEKKSVKKGTAKKAATPGKPVIKSSDAKTEMKKATKSVVQQNKPNTTATSLMKHDTKIVDKVGGLAEKNNIKDLGLLNKGKNFSN